jgi:hypothetical protein
MLLVSLLMMPRLQTSDESRSKILKIYNWADYIDEDLLMNSLNGIRSKQERISTSSTRFSI